MPDRARVSIIDHNSGKKYQVQLPTNVTTKQLMPYLVRDLGLPQGRYTVALETEGGRAQLEEDKTLNEAGVHEGSVLRILPEMTAGQKEGDYAVL